MSTKERPPPMRVLMRRCIDTTTITGQHGHNTGATENPGDAIGGGVQVHLQNTAQKVAADGGGYPGSQKATTVSRGGAQLKHLVGYQFALHQQYARASGCIGALQSLRPSCTN
ncbi:hypothetical protein ACP4OV_029809 [Aristida adscensionis]